MNQTEFQAGDRVVRSPQWQPNPEFDAWGRGEGIGVVVSPPFPMDDDTVDVCWPAGRCFEPKVGLMSILDIGLIKTTTKVQNNE